MSETEVLQCEAEDKEAEADEVNAEDVSETVADEESVADADNDNHSAKPSEDVQSTKETVAVGEPEEEANDDSEQEPCEYEDDFEADNDEVATSPKDNDSKSGSPAHGQLSPRALQLIEGKMSEILETFGSVEDEESQYVLDKDCEKKGASSVSSGSSCDETEVQDEADGGEEDVVDGATDAHRLERLHTIIRQNDFRKFRWFTSLFLSDVVELEELCQVPLNGFTALSLLGGLGRTKMLKRLSEIGVLLYHQDSEGQAAIHRAVRNGRVKTTSYLCTLGQDSYQDADGMTPMHICATTLHVKVMEVLTQHCTTMDVPYGSSSLTPLMLACMNGCVPMVECLLQHSAKTDASTSVGNTCLHLAAANNQIKVVQKLLEAEHAADVINKQNQQGATPLLTALQLQHLDVFDKLLEEGADPIVPEQHGMGAAHVAAMLGLEAAVTLLELHAADLNVRDARGATPLLLSVSQGRKQIVSKLLSLGVDVNQCDTEGIGPLHAAAREGDAALVTELLGCGARVDEATAQGVTPLVTAVTGAHADVIKTLLDNNADPNLLIPPETSGRQGITPMQVAFQGMKMEVIELLMAAGGSPFQPVVSGDGLPPVSIAIRRRHARLLNTVMNKFNDTPTLYKLIKCCTLEDVEFLRQTHFQQHRDKQNGFGWTVLHHASMEGNALAADILLRLGCNPNIQDHDGNTPAHFACLHGHGHLVEVLTGNAYNTDVSIVNKKGDTCTNLAVQSGNEEIVSLLLSQTSSSGDSRHILPLLVQAITSGKSRVAEMMFTNGCAETLRFNDWKQLLHIGVEHGSARLVTLMLEKGPVDVHTSVTDSQETCLHLAARSGNLEASLELLMLKSDVNKVNALQRKPIHYAALEGHTHIVEVLLDCGTKVSLVDEEGMPDYYLCRHRAVWDVLKKWCKTHPGSVTTSPSPSAPAGDQLDGRRAASRASRSSTSSVIGEVDGFQEIGSTPVHSRPPQGASGSGSAPQRRSSSQGASPRRSGRQQSVFSHFRDVLS